MLRVMINYRTGVARLAGCDELLVDGRDARVGHVVADRRVDAAVHAVGEEGAAVAVALEVDAQDLRNDRPGVRPACHWCCAGTPAAGPHARL